MTTLFAQPYDISASGFYFESMEEYQAKAAKARNDYGQPVEEFEIQFIDGEGIDTELGQAIGLDQGNFGAFLEFCDDLDDDQKIRLIIAYGECGYTFDAESCDPDGFDIDLYELDTMRELAELLVDEGLMGDIPERLMAYFDYDALARDLAVDYSQISVNGRGYVYRCG